MNLLGIGDLINSIGKITDDLFTSDEERLKIALQEKLTQSELVRDQLSINREEAKHTSIVVAGWRPAIGWVGAIALAYQFIIYPLLTWFWSYAQASGAIPAELAPPPTLPSDTLWVVLSGMLGVAGMRSFDKAKGIQTDKIQK